MRSLGSSPASDLIRLMSVQERSNLLCRGGVLSLCDHTVGCKQVTKRRTVNEIGPRWRLLGGGTYGPLLVDGDNDGIT